MKRAQEIVRVTQQAEAIVGCKFDDPCVSQEPTLAMSAWRARAAVFENAITNAFLSSAEAAPLAAQAALLVLEKYQDLQKARCQLVPLTENDWHRWLHVVEATAARVLQHVEELSDDSSAAKTRGTLSRAFVGLHKEAEALYQSCCWSSLQGARARRAAHAAWLAAQANTVREKLLWVFNELAASSPPLTETTRSGGAHEEAAPTGGERLLHEAFDSVLQRHSRVSYEEEAELVPLGEDTLETLFRESFLEPLLASLDEEEEREEERALGKDAGTDSGASRTTHAAAMRPCVEGWMRQSFRREVAFAWYVDTQTIVDAYNEFEVYEKKQAEMKHFIKVTRNAQFEKTQHAARALSGHFIARMQTKLRDAHVPTAAAPEARHSNGTNADAETQAAVSDLLRAWEATRGVEGLPWTAASPLFRCFSLCMRRVLDLEPFPGSFTAGQLEKTLYHFHGWFAKYVSIPHRWTPAFPFSAEDDEDLWVFAVERHNVLLARALAAEATAAESPEAAASNSAILRTFGRRWRRMHTVSLSMVHAWQTYLSVLHSVECRSRLERKVARATQATHAVSEWFDARLVHGFAKAFMNDLYNVAESRAFTGADEAAVLLMEAELKVFVCDVLLALGAAHSPIHRISAMLEARKRLQAMTDGVHEFVEATLTSKGDGPSTIVDADTIRDLLAVWGRLLGRLRQSTAMRNVAFAAAGASHTNIDSDENHVRGEEERELLRYLLRGYKELAHLASRFEQPSAKEEAMSQLQLLLFEYPICAEVSESEERRRVIAPCLPLYADPKAMCKKGGRERIPLGGVLDLACQDLAMRWTESGEESLATPSRHKRAREETATKTRTS